MSRVTTHVKWDGDRFKEHMEREARRNLGLAAVEIQREMITRLSGPSPSAPGSAPGVSTGALRRSINIVQTGLSVAVGTNLQYGRWLEYGFTATAKRTKYLPVPLNHKARLAQRRVASVRQIPGLRFMATKRGAFLVKHVGGKKARVEFWFVLKKRVRVAPRPWLRPSLTAALPRAQAKFQAGMAQALLAFQGRAA